MKQARADNSGDITLVRLQPGESLLETLHNAVAEPELTAGILVSGVGSLADVTLRAATTADGRHGYTPAMYRPGPWEVTSLQGQFGPGRLGTAEHHLHGTFADEHGGVVAGHVDAATVLVTLEVAILLPSSVSWLRSNAAESAAVEGMPVLEPYSAEHCQGGG